MRHYTPGHHTWINLLGAQGKNKPVGSNPFVPSALCTFYENATCKYKRYNENLKDGF